MNIFPSLTISFASEHFKVSNCTILIVVDYSWPITIIFNVKINRKNKLLIKKPTIEQPKLMVPSSFICSSYTELMPKFEWLIISLHVIWLRDIYPFDTKSVFKVKKRLLNKNGDHSYTWKLLYMSKIVVVVYCLSSLNRNGIAIGRPVKLPSPALRSINKTGSCTNSSADLSLSDMQQLHARINVQTRSPLTIRIQKLTTNQFRTPALRLRLFIAQGTTDVDQ